MMYIYIYNQVSDTDTVCNFAVLCRFCLFGSVRQRSALDLDQSNNIDMLFKVPLVVGFCLQQERLFNVFNEHSIYRFLVQIAPAKSHTHTELSSLVSNIPAKNRHLNASMSLFAASQKPRCIFFWNKVGLQNHLGER